MELINLTALKFFINEDLYLIKTENQPFLKQQLVDTTRAIDENVPVKTALNISYIGSNEKKITIVVSPDLKPQHLGALENSLALKQLKITDVAIINYSDIAQITFDRLIEEFEPQKIIFFGVGNEAFSLPYFELNNINIYKNIKLLFTYSFDDMLGNKEKTRAYWNPMKVL